MSDVETEAAEAQAWMEMALRCGYCTVDQFEQIFQRYERLIGSIVGMIDNAEKWCRVSKVVKETVEPYDLPPSE